MQTAALPQADSFLGRHGLSGFRQIALAAALGVLAAGTTHAVSISALPDMSLLTPYAVFGNYVNVHNADILGKVGISNGGKIALESPSTISGTLSLGIGATTSGGGYPDNVTPGVPGGITTGLDLTATQNQVFSASSVFAGYAADTTLTSLDTGLAISGNGGVKVVTITGNVKLDSGEHISFTGGPGEYLVLNIQGKLEMSGDARIGTPGQASHIIVNLVNTGNLGLVAMVNNRINGTTLIPYATYSTFHSVTGAIYAGYGGDGPYNPDGGDGGLKLMSDAQVTYVPFETVPDAGSSLILMSIALGSLVIARKRLAARR